MFHNWGVVPRREHLCRVSSSASIVAGVLNLPWIGCWEILAASLGKWFLYCSWSSSRTFTMDRAVSSYVCLFFSLMSHSLTVSWSLRQGNYPHFKDGEVETQEVKWACDLECHGAVSHQCPLVFFPCSVSSSLLNPLLLFFLEGEFVAP